MRKKLTLLGQADRNKHGQACVRVQCSCGSPEFVVRADSFKQGRTTSCGFCRKGGRKHKPALVPAPKPEQVPAQEVESTFERDSPAWFEEKIASALAAAITAEKHVQDLQAQMAASEATDLDLLKRWTAESTVARKLRQDIARFRTQKANAETATKKDTRTQAEITRDKIAALKGAV